VKGDSAEALPRWHGRLQCWQLGQSHDLAIEVVPALELEEQKAVILPKQQPIGRLERRLLGREMLEHRRCGVHQLVPSR
jgi:hypothetical protein